MSKQSTVTIVRYNKHLSFKGTANTAQPASLSFLSNA